MSARVLRAVRRIQSRAADLVITALVHGLARAPHKMSEILVRTIAALLRLLRVEPARTAWTNLLFCYPNWDMTYRKRIWRANLLHTARLLVDMPKVWLSPPEAINRRIGAVHGLEHWQYDRPLLVICPHVGHWELVGHWSAMNGHKLTCLYQQPMWAALDRLMHQGRTRFGQKLITADQHGMRALMRAIRAGDSIGILPDQNPPEARHWAPFMGMSANTIGLIWKLLRMHELHAVFAVAMWRADSDQFDIIIRPAGDLNAETMDASLRHMNAAIEDIIRLDPTQYLWSYKRFRGNPRVPYDPIKIPKAFGIKAT